MVIYALKLILGGIEIEIGKKWVKNLNIFIPVFCP